MGFRFVVLCVKVLACTWPSSLFTRLDMVRLKMTRGLVLQLMLGTLPAPWLRFDISILPLRRYRWSRDPVITVFVKVSGGEQISESPYGWDGSVGDARHHVAKFTSGFYDAICTR